MGFRTTHSINGLYYNFESINNKMILSFGNIIF